MTEIINAKLFELEILRTDDSKEEISYFTDLFYDLLSLLQTISGRALDFSDETF
jgi:hypothetical protein